MEARVWVTKAGRGHMIYFRYGFSFVFPEGGICTPLVSFATIHCDNVIKEIQQLDKCVTMESVGKTTANEQEIYEGDILRISFNGSLNGSSGEETGIARWDKSHCRFVIQTTTKKRSFYAKKIHILGNVFQDDLTQFGLSEEFDQWGKNFTRRS